MVFAQFNLVTNVALKLNVCGNPVGGLAITVVWSSDSMEAALAEAFVSKLGQMFLEVISEDRVSAIIHRRETLHVYDDFACICQLP